MAKRDLAKYRDMVLVNWRDSATVASRWIYEEDAMRHALEDYRIDSVGFVLHNSKLHLTLGLSVDDSQKRSNQRPMWNHCLQIPHDCIQSIEILRKAKK